MNKVILIGMATKDAEVRYSNEKAIARFTLAVDRIGDGTDFINCVSFGKTAEFMEKYGRKGVKFATEGRIQTGSYQDKDGKKIYTTDVVVERVEFCESKKVEETASPSNNYDFMAITEDDDLPFN